MKKSKPAKKLLAGLLVTICGAVVCSHSTALALSESASAPAKAKNSNENRTVNMSQLAALPSSPIDKEYLNELGIEAITDSPLAGISEYKLKSNGMRILLVERHETPIVNTTVVYHVGSRNEAVGYTGSTHFLEHMMFKGTPTFDPLSKTGIDDVLKKIGGINNATTWYDRTNYYEVVPAAHLELCLKIEADRIRNLNLREADRTAEMTVVRNELERGEDSPSELLENNLFAMAFKEHPYHHPVIGWRSDVEGVPTSRLKKFYDDFYYPDNASLILIGDFNSKEALRLVSHYFGSIPKAPHQYPDVYTKEPPQEGERRFTVRRGSDLPRVTVGFHVPECLDKATYALDVMEQVLGDSSKRSSRLYKRLVETGLASEVNCYVYSLKDPGLFVVNAQSNTGVDPKKLEAAILDELSKLKTGTVTDKELQKAKNSLTKSLRLAVADPMGLASQLTEAIASANWRWWVDYPNNVEKVSAQDIKEIAKKYFLEDNRTVGYYYPKETETAKTDKGAAKDASEKSEEKPAQEKTASGAAQDDKGKTEPKEKEDPKPADAERAATEGGDSPAEDTAALQKLIPSLGKSNPIEIGKRVKRIRLENGLTIMVLPLAGSSTVALSGKLNAGDHFCDPAKTQVPYLVAELLTKGSKGFSKETLADELELMGSNLEFSSGSFWAEFDTQVVKEDLPKMIGLVSDTLQNPMFPADELKLEKTLRRSDLKERLADTGDMSWNVLLRKLYKPSSGFYQKDFTEQITELDTIKQKDLKSFHAEHYRPGNMVISLVGDITEGEAKQLCEKYFASWQGEAREKIAVTSSDTIAIKKSEEVVVELPDKANVDVVIARTVPVDLKSKDYFATLLGNAALGYDSFACRLAPVRDKYGLTYGISSSLDDPTAPFGTWSIKFSVNPDNLKRAKEIVAKIVGEYLKDGIKEAELETEKSHLSGVFSVYLRSPRHIASRLSFYELLGLEPTYIDDYQSSLSKVSVNDVNNAIRKYFELDETVTAISGTLQTRK